jgi:hypothetical protein
MKKQLPSIFMQMHNGTRTGEGSFNVTLKNVFYAADKPNRQKLVTAFPEFFGNEVPEFEIYKKPELPTLPEMAASNFDNIAELAERLSTGNVSHQGRTILGLARRNSEFIRKYYS